MGDGPHYSDGGKPPRPATLADVKVEPLISDQGLVFRVTKPSDVGSARVRWSLDLETRAVVDVSITAPPPPSTPR